MWKQRDLDIPSACGHPFVYGKSHFWLLSTTYESLSWQAVWTQSLTLALQSRVTRMVKSTWFERPGTELNRAQNLHCTVQWEGQVKWKQGGLDIPIAHYPPTHTIASKLSHLLVFHELVCEYNMIWSPICTLLSIFGVLTNKWAEQIYGSAYWSIYH